MQFTFDHTTFQQWESLLHFYVQLPKMHKTWIDDLFYKCMCLVVIQPFFLNKTYKFS